MHNIRPQNFDEFKGKKQIKDNLKIFIESSKKNNTSLDHVLLYGLAGTGKTSLAYIVANEFQKKIKIIQGSQIQKNTDLINVLSLICDGDFIFIDEIHAMGLECFETLYSVLEDYTIDIKIGRDNNLKHTRVKMPLFTLIAATTNINKIPKALEERFGISFYFDLYNDEELYDIVIQTASKINLRLSDEELKIVSLHSKGIPRIANKLLKRIYDYKNVESTKNIKEILTSIGVEHLGLEPMDIIYLKAFDKQVNLGLKTIASITNFDLQVIENRIEPFLIKNNFIVKTTKGRILTNEGSQLLKLLTI